MISCCENLSTISIGFARLFVPELSIYKYQMIGRKSFCHKLEPDLVALVTKVHFIFYFNDIIAVNIFFV